MMTKRAFLVLWGRAQWAGAELNGKCNVNVMYLTHGNVIFDILEPSAFQKYSICWVFRSLSCSNHFYMYFALQFFPLITAVIFPIIWKTFGVITCMLHKIEIITPMLIFRVLQTNVIIEPISQGLKSGPDDPSTKQDFNIAVGIIFWYVGMGLFRGDSISGVIHSS